MLWYVCLEMSTNCLEFSTQLRLSFSCIWLVYFCFFIFLCSSIAQWFSHLFICSCLLKPNTCYVMCVWCWLFSKRFLIRYNCTFISLSMLSGLVGSRKPKIESNIKIKCLIIHQKRTKLIAKHVYLLEREMESERTSYTHY